MSTLSGEFQQDKTLRAISINSCDELHYMRVSSVIDRVQIITPQKAIEYLQLGAGKTARGYLWPVLDPLRGAVHYSWKLGRGHEELVGILSLGKTGGFSGTIQCDGFSAYETLARRYPEIQLGGCLAHIRRKFYEAREQVPEVVMPILQSIQRLYRIEENLRQSGAPPGCRELVRRSKSRPIVNELQKKITAELGVHLPKSNLGKALRYALGQWSGFARYMKDGRLEIDNNLVENAIRPTKLGAKNYLFFGSATAGINSATIYTLMANCKALGIDLAKNALGDQFQFRRRAVTVIFNVNVLRMPTAKSQRDVA